MNDPQQPLKLVVTGSRYLDCQATSFDKVMEFVILSMHHRRNVFHIDEPCTMTIAQGGAKGADQLVRQWAKRQDVTRVKSVTFEANWNQHGRAAGPIRNILMLKKIEPELVLGFWDGTSPGTKHCITLAAKLGFQVLIIPIKGNKLCQP